MSPPPPSNATFLGHNSLIKAVAFSPDGKWLVSIGADRMVRVYDAQTGAVRQASGPSRGELFCLAFHPDSKSIAVGSGDPNTARLLSVGDGSERLSYEGHNKQILSVAFSPDGKRLATGSEDASIRLWDVASGQPLRVLQGGHSGGVACLAFSPDGQTLASGSMDQTVRSVGRGQRRAISSS